jgi:hypothetical protein
MVIVHCGYPSLLLDVHLNALGSLHRPCGNNCVSCGSGSQLEHWFAKVGCYDFKYGLTWSTGRFSNWLINLGLCLMVRFAAIYDRLPWRMWTYAKQSVCVFPFDLDHVLLTMPIIPIFVFSSRLNFCV